VVIEMAEQTTGTHALNCIKWYYWVSATVLESQGSLLSLDNGCAYRILVVLLFLSADVEMYCITDHNHDFVWRGGNQKVCL
jgi:hypothetical protein